MWFEILLVFLLEASFLTAYESEEEETYHNYRIPDFDDDDDADDDDFPDDLEDPVGRPKRSDENDTMEPQELELIKGGIQALFNDIGTDYAGPTNPTRTSAQDVTTSATTIVTTNMAVNVTTNLPTNVTRTTLADLVTQLVAGNLNLSSTLPNSTRRSYTELLEQLIDYVDKQTTIEPPISTTTAQILPPPTGSRAALRQAKNKPKHRPRGGGRFKNRRASTTKYRRTRNTLCTHSDDICETMCFDDEKYRVSCTSTVPSATSYVPRMDVHKVLHMLSSIVVDYDTNITEQLYRALLKKGYKPCGVVKTTVTETTITTVEETQMYDYELSNKTGAVISKCFVCGLDDEGIPLNAHCSDAFAGEFIPMTPVDASARGHLATYRKYCKFMDMFPWYVNGSDSRSMWGRWTGGCAVRWVDISGVYTQRSCRNRARPVVGRHLLSKRMARLEMALINVDNGCIISPMASLVPFSRGVSLFARFHACVCTGNFCNQTTRLDSGPWILVLALVLLFNSCGS